LARAGIDSKTIASAMPFAGVLLKQEQDLIPKSSHSGSAW